MVVRAENSTVFVAWLRVSGSDVELLSRNEKQLNGKYPELVEAFRSQSSNAFAVDGENRDFRRGP